MSQSSTGLSDGERKVGGVERGPDDDEVLDSIALAKFLNVSFSGLHKLIAARQAPPGFRVGRLWRWRKSVVVRWVAEQEAA